MKARATLWVIGLALSLSAIAAPPVKPFRTESLAQIRAAHEGTPFVLVLWSLDCPPCFRELELLGRIHESAPALELVLVATEPYGGAGIRSAIRATLARFGLAQLEAWAFSGDPQRLRYKIDPRWYGELPRSYFYSPGERRHAVSGRLQQARMRAFVARSQRRSVQ